MNDVYEDIDKNLHQSDLKDRKRIKNQMKENVFVRNNLYDERDGLMDLIYAQFGTAKQIREHLYPSNKTQVTEEMVEKFIKKYSKWLETKIGKSEKIDKYINKDKLANNKHKRNSADFSAPEELKSKKRPGTYSKTNMRHSRASKNVSETNNSLSTPSRGNLYTNSRIEKAFEQKRKSEIMPGIARMRTKSMKRETLFMPKTPYEGIIGNTGLMQPSKFTGYKEKGIKTCENSVLSSCNSKDQTQGFITKTNLIETPNHNQKRDKRLSSIFSSPQASTIASKMNPRALFKLKKMTRFAHL